MKKSILKPQATITLYTPFTVKMEEILNENPPEFKYHIDYFTYILHLVNDIAIKRKDEGLQSTPLYSKLLKTRLGSDYRKYLDYLVQNSILLEERQYMKGSYSRKFKFAPPHDSAVLLPTPITKPTLIKSHERFINLGTEGLRLIPEPNEKDYQYLLKWYNKRLKIDYDKSRKHLFDLWNQEVFQDTETATQKYARRMVPVEKINRAELFPNFDTTAGRLHSPITQLKKELRPFLTYDGQKLVSIDITNSQPYLSTMLFNKEAFERNKLGQKIVLYKSRATENYYHYSPNSFSKMEKRGVPSDVSLYIQHVASGQFYEEFAKVLIQEDLIPSTEKDHRKYAKNIAFRTLFSPNRHKQFVREIQLFNKTYPNVYKNFAYLKRGYREHNTLACLLQNIEAEIILKIICKEISKTFPKAPIFTIHDSIITTKDYYQFVKEIMERKLTELVGIPPQLSIEEW